MNDDIIISRGLATWYVYTIIGAWLSAGAVLLRSYQLNNGGGAS